MGDGGRTPFAASVRHAGRAEREGSFDMGDAEGPDEFPLSDADERARRERLNSPTPRPQVTDEEKAALIAGCLDAVEAWRGVYGAADLLVRGLAARLGTSTEEAEALVLAEQARWK